MLYSVRMDRFSGLVSKLEVVEMATHTRTHMSWVPGIVLRDCPLITRRGETTREGGGASEVLPLQNGGGGAGGKRFNHAEEGTQQVLRYF